MTVEYFIVAEAKRILRAVVGRENMRILHWTKLFLTLLLFLPTVPLCRAQSRVVSEHSIVTFTKDRNCRYFAATPDLKHTAFITDLGSTRIAEEQKDVENELGKALKKSLDPNLHRDLAATLVPGSQVVVVDGIEVGPFESVGPPILFSHDGAHVAFKTVEHASASSSARVVMDGVPQPRYKDVSSLRFASNGNHFAYVAQKKIGSDRFTSVVLDGKELGWCDQMDDEGKDLWLSADGTRYAWRGNRAGADGKMQGWLCIDGKEEGPFEDIGEGTSGVTFSGDGKHVAWFATRLGSKGERGATVLVVEGKEQQLKTNLSRHGELAFSSDGKRVSYSAGDRIVVFEADTTQEFSGRSTPQVNPDDSHLPLIAPKGNADGAHSAYLSQLGSRACVVKDGKSGASFPGYAAENSLVISPNGSRTAWVLNNPARSAHSVILDGKAQLPVSFVEPQSLKFSPDGRHFAYVVHNFGEYVVLDGMKGKTYQTLLPTRDDLFQGQHRSLLVFDENGTLRYVAKTATDLLLVEVKAN